MIDLNAIDLFGGPGGWDYACRILGFDPLGIEWDDAAVATREAVGLRTLQADVSELDPLDHGPCELVIACVWVTWNRQTQLRSAFESTRKFSLRRTFTCKDLPLCTERTGDG